MSDAVDAERLRERLGAMDDERPRRGRKASRSSPLRPLGAIAAFGLIVVVAYGVGQTRQEAEEPLGTAEPAPWQGRGDGYETMTAPTAAAQAATAPVASVPQATPAAAQPSQAPTLPAGPSAAERDMMDTLAELRAELDALRKEAANEDELPAQDDGGDERLEALATQVATLTSQADELREEAREADRLANLQESQERLLRAQLEAAQSELDAERFGEAPTNTITGEPFAAGTDEDARRLAELADRRAQAEDLQQARIDSPMVAFGGSATAADASAAAPPPELGQNEDFLRAGARPATVEQAVVIANPSRTVIQGTVIQAAMETAIDSSLPGAIRAVVSEDVHSFDGTLILIPRGSKLIGRYNSQVEPTQRRLMIAWDRIVTPDGQSVTIAAYGADELGRSGTTGRIDRRLGTRFGSAALVSLISALPSAAAAQVNDPLAADLAEELGGDAEDAAGSVLSGYLSVPPTIYVDQGARITVMVDRDLELL